ncbi:HNH endonuclease [Kitasatospora sp. NBC_00070]|uniref:HNH endonuclease n=1 Tax=Kitasatospora sp. NBC_00070 TaxID=2975962 RepID=UPI0032441BDA
MRRSLRAAGSGTCVACTVDYLPSALEVDHIQPLSKGGTDTADNVQLLCKGCHRAKTRRDLGHETPPF